jgi:hypothetical protein
MISDPGAACIVPTQCHAGVFWNVDVARSLGLNSNRNMAQ